MADNPEIKRLRAERARQEAIREGEIVRDAAKRGALEARKAHERLADVDKAQYDKDQKQAERAVELGVPVAPKEKSLSDRVKAPRKKRGFPRRGDRERER